MWHLKNSKTVNMLTVFSWFCNFCCSWAMKLIQSCFGINFKRQKRFKPLFCSNATFENFNCQWHTENFTIWPKSHMKRFHCTKKVLFLHHCSLKLMLMCLFDWNSMKKAIKCPLTSQISTDTMTFQWRVTSGGDFNFRFLSQLAVFQR